MRMRIISAAVVLGLGIVGITLAQSGGGPSKQPAIDRAKLRPQVAKLRAEVEILQLEHEADAEILKKLMADIKNLDSLEAAKGSMKDQMEALLKGSSKEQKDQMEAFKAATNGQLPPTPGAIPVPPAEFGSMFGTDEAMAKIARPILDRLKKEFVPKAAELHEKRLELDDLERRYNEAR